MKRILVFLLLFTVCSRLQAQRPVSFKDEITGKTGFKDANGKIVIKPQYDRVFTFEDDDYALVNFGFDYKGNKGGKWGAIDTSGKIIIPIKYDKIAYIGYNLFAVNVGEIFSNMDATEEGKFAIFNASGKALTPFVYTGYVSSVEFQQGYATLETYDAKTKVQKYGLLDSTGKVAVPAQYDRIGAFSDGLAVIELNGKRGYMDRKNKNSDPP